MTAILVKMAEHAPRLDPISTSAPVLTDSLDHDAYKVLGNDKLDISTGFLNRLLFHPPRKKQLVT